MVRSLPHATHGNRVQVEGWLYREHGDLTAKKKKHDILIKMCWRNFSQHDANIRNHKGVHSS
ncbi:mCG1033966 [Mus musculus]|nr:mCG1033966 [Mus musculus]